MFSFASDSLVPLVAQKGLEGRAFVCSVTLFTLTHVDSNMDSVIDIDHWIHTDCGMDIEM